MPEAADHDDQRGGSWSYDEQLPERAALTITVPPGGTPLGDALQRCGLRLDMGVRDIEARLALTDDDMLTLGRLKRSAGVGAATWDAELDREVATTAHGFLLYLLFGDIENA